MTRPSVMKIITTFVVDTTNVQIYLHSLNNPEEIKASLKLTSKFTPETKTETDLKKGKDFTYTGKKKNTKGKDTKENDTKK
jgi:predicted aldo/keto reductase-like oxidoreductase